MNASPKDLIILCRNNFRNDIAVYFSTTEFVLIHKNTLTLHPQGDELQLSNKELKKYIYENIPLILRIDLLFTYDRFEKGYTIYNEGVYYFGCTMKNIVIKMKHIDRLLKCYNELLKKQRIVFTLQQINSYSTENKKIENDILKLEHEYSTLNQLPLNEQIMALIGYNQVSFGKAKPVNNRVSGSSFGKAKHQVSFGIAGKRSGDRLHSQSFLCSFGKAKPVNNRVSGSSFGKAKRQVSFGKAKHQVSFGKAKHQVSFGKAKRQVSFGIAESNILEKMDNLLKTEYYHTCEKELYLNNELVNLRTECANLLKNIPNNSIDERELNTVLKRERTHNTNLILKRNELYRISDIKADLIALAANKAKVATSYTNKKFSMV